jgi:ectoine hydroxylase-related dioxygenase (phytanoyl-CoA dioxygenase family)
VLRNPKGVAITRWHVDDVVEFPLPEDLPHHDFRTRMPVQWFTIQMALSDIDSVEDGPTQFVPGSHYSGRHPNNQEHPEFEGRGPVSMLCKAGDIYLQNNQCWHRGAPVLSDRVRYVFQSQYAARWAFTRFGEYNRVPVPNRVLEKADERLSRVLGLRPSGPAKY